MNLACYLFTIYFQIFSLTCFPWVKTSDFIPIFLNNSHFSFHTFFWVRKILIIHQISMLLWEEGVWGEVSTLRYILKRGTLPQVVVMQINHLIVVCDRF